MPVIFRDEKSGWDSSCLHNDVPRTPHPTMAMLEDDDGDDDGDDDDDDGSTVGELALRDGVDDDETIIIGLVK